MTSNGSQEGDSRENKTGATEIISRTVPAATKTPYYQATQALRYQRQAIIGSIQQNSDARLLCYIAGREAPIDRDDILGFVDLLHNVPPSTNVDLMLHTIGGDVDAAEKLISLVRNKVGPAVLRIVVPDFAKSAGTLMVLGADRVVMSDMSELGAIDPQVILTDSNGTRRWHSVLNYLDAYDAHSQALNADPTDATARLMLGKLDPATVKLFEATRDRARKFAEDQLKLGMFKDEGNWSRAAGELMDTKRWQSHSQMISWQDAQDPTIGLLVDYLEPKSIAWQEYWQLYCLQRLDIAEHQKLFESDYVSFKMPYAVG